MQLYKLGHEVLCSTIHLKCKLLIRHGNRHTKIVFNMEKENNNKMAKDNAYTDLIFIAENTYLQVPEKSDHCKLL